jgi:ribosomal protein L24
MRPFEELLVLDHAVELGMGDEVVVLPVDFAGRIGRVVAETERRIAEIAIEQACARSSSCPRRRASR